jgi:hypothetical protein
MVDTVIDTSEPDGTTKYLSDLDDAIRATRAGFQERLNRDHDFQKTGDVIDDGCGQHRKVHLVELQAAPAMGAGETCLYAKDDGGGNADIYIVADVDGTDSDKKLVGNDGSGNTVLHLTSEDIAYITDNETIYEDGDGKLAVQLDDVTLGYDATAKIQVKVPDAAGSGTASQATFVIVGTYTGNNSGSERTITIGDGVEIRHLAIRRSDAGNGAFEMVNLGGGDFVTFATADATVWSAVLYPAANGFSLAGSASWIAQSNLNAANGTGITYYFVAHCVRT